MDLLAVRIETARLAMVPAHAGRAGEVFAAFTPAVAQHMFPQPARHIDETLDFIAAARAKMAAGEELVVFIARRASGEFVGCGGLHRLMSGAPEVGIWIKAAAQDQGLGPEAVEGLIRWAMAACAPRHIVYPVMIENVRSRRIPEKLGGRLTRSFRKANAAGVMRDLVEYVIPLPLPKPGAR
jgi:[ribosomal protein S5]-alanine N-acetyltransferase